jgi:RNase P/RNase MRP subunit p30
LGIIRAVARHGRVFEVPIRPVLVSSGVERAGLMRKITRFLRLCNKYGADYVLTSRAKDVYEVKHPQELISIGLALGLSHDQSLRAITEVPKGLMKV